MGFPDDENNIAIHSWYLCAKVNRTRAHVFAIMLAYMIAYELRRLWRDIEVTIEEGIAELSSLCATEVAIGNLSIQTIPIPTENVKIFLEKADITLPDVIPCRKPTVFTRKKSVEERRSSVQSKCQMENNCKWKVRCVIACETEKYCDLAA